MFKLIHIVFIACLMQVYSITPQRVNPFQRDLTLLLQEPPLELFNNVSRNGNQVQELWFTQKLDHFNKTDLHQTWQMRYMRNDKYFKSGGPIFVFVGGEWEITKGFLLTGQMHDIARQHSGMMYYTEHRFYGKSWPLSTITTRNLKYLNVRQSLADLAYFIIDQKAKHSGLETSKVILTGGSYSGSMVAWFKKLHPQIITAGWASSAPMFVTMDFYEYMEVTGAVIAKKGGSRCFSIIQAGMEGLAQILQSKQANDLLNKLRICKTFNPKDAMDLAAFFNGIGNYFAAIVQSYSSEIKTVCDYLNSLNTNDIEAFITFLNYIYWPNGLRNTQKCLDFSFASMKQLFTATSDKSQTTRQWFYQTCSEFGWYTTTAYSQRHPFARQVPLAYFQRLCQAAFGASYTLSNMSLGIRETNINFPDVSASEYENIFFSHGELDPWRAVGFQSGKNVLIIPDASHTSDLSSINLNDSIAMNLGKLKITNFINYHLRKY